MKIALLSIIALILQMCPIAAKKQSGNNLKMLVGTYTEGSNSDGIYLYQFNQKTGEVGKKVVSAKAENPSYAVFSNNGKNVYAVSEFNDGRQGVYSFSIDPRTDKLTLLGKQSTIFNTFAKERALNAGADPCFILVNGNYAYTANYTGGNMSIFPIDKSNGELLRITQLNSYNYSKYVSSHIHDVVITPDDKYIIFVDLGSDCIYRYNIGDKSGNLIENCTQLYSGEKGNGPRHITFSPNGKYAYLINELGGQLTVFAYDDGKLNKIQEVMADEGGGHSSAEVQVSPDGKYVYTSHRLKKDGISIFKIDQSNGFVTKVGYQLTGIHPRFFCITPNGKYLLVACKDSNEIQIFKINKSTGTLKDIHKPIKVSKPSCITFF